MKRITSLVLMVTAFLGITFSCSEEELVADGVGDAFIVAKKSGEGSQAVTVYGLALHGFGNKSFSKVTAKLPGSGERELSSYNGYPYDFYYETPGAEFSVNPPAKGNYVFSFSFITAETDADTDNLSDLVIAPATITKCAWDAANARLQMEWTALDKADYYVISVENPVGKVVFTSEALGASKVSHDISATTAHWYEAPVNGVSYTVVLGAFMYEPNATHLNIQAKSLAAATVVWGAAS